MSVVKRALFSATFATRSGLFAASNVCRVLPSESALRSAFCHACAAEGVELHEGVPEDVLASAIADPGLLSFEDARAYLQSSSVFTINGGVVYMADDGECQRNQMESMLLKVAAKIPPAGVSGSQLQAILEDEMPYFQPSSVGALSLKDAIQSYPHVFVVDSDATGKWTVKSAASTPSNVPSSSPGSVGILDFCRRKALSGNQSNYTPLRLAMQKMGINDRGLLRELVTNEEVSRALQVKLSVRLRPRRPPVNGICFVDGDEIGPNVVEAMWKALNLLDQSTRFVVRHPTSLKHSGNDIIAPEDMPTYALLELKARELTLRQPVILQDIIYICSSRQFALYAEHLVKLNVFPDADVYVCCPSKIKLGVEGGTAVVLPGMLRRLGVLHFRRSFVWLADDGGGLFERYTEIENSNERRINALKACGMFDDEWIATEKVHGANFGIYSIEGEKTVRYAKRSGIMPPTEHFFGYHILIPQLQQYASGVCGLLCEKLQKKLHTVIVNGELFGGKYDHPSLPRTRKTVMVAGKPRAISAVQMDSFPQYSPDLHFYAFDIKYKETSDSEYVTLTFDEATEIFQKIPGLLYARAIIRGPMSKVAAFDVEHFVTTIPPLVGMGNYPLKGNWAEGLVVKHAKRGKSGFDPKGLTILKFKCTAFQEISTDKGQGPRVDEMENVRRDSISRSGVQLPDIQSIIQDPVQLEASKFLLDHVCENRLNSVLSKIGTDPFEKEEITPDALATLLAKDALKDFLKDTEPAIVNIPILTRRDMARYVLFESRRLVCSRWKTILQRQTADITD